MPVERLREGDPFRSARDDREGVVARIVDRRPDRVMAALQGDREALIDLLLFAAEVSWQSRAEILGTVEEVAARVHRFADEVADCYSDEQPPSDRLCDLGFALADHVDALAIEVLHRRQEAGMADGAALPQPARQPGREARHLARAHAAALREAAGAQRLVTRFDAEAAADLYLAIVAIARQENARTASAALRPPRARQEPPPNSP